MLVGQFNKLGEKNLSVYTRRLLSRFSVESIEYVPSFYKKTASD